MDHRKLWGEDLRLSSDADIILDEIKQEDLGLSSDSDILLHEIKQEDELLDASEENIEVDVTNEFSTDKVCYTTKFIYVIFY